MKPHHVIPQIMAIVDLDYAGNVKHWLEKIRCLSDLPEDPSLCVQIRAKGKQSRSPEQLARLARDAFKNSTVPLIWNGDANIAVSCGYSGVHQPASLLARLDESCQDLLHSTSVHNEEELVFAVSKSVQFVIFSPIFQPHWKPVVVQGLSALKKMVSLSSTPILALGGVSRETLPEIGETGAYGVATLSQVMENTDPVEYLLDLLLTWRICVGRRLSEEAGE